MARVLAGVFVGGASRRMGADKALLRGPDGAPLAARLVSLLREEVGVDAVTLVGTVPAAARRASEPNERGEASERVERVEDDPPGIGPLGGLVALLRWAAARDAKAQVIAVACDMPFVSAALLRRLVDAPPAPVVAPRRVGRGGDDPPWEPLVARYDVARVLPTAERRARSTERGARSLQALLREVGAVPLPLSLDEEALLGDWDEPADVAVRDVPARVIDLARAGAARDQLDRVIVEEPLDVRVNGRTVAITMRTPGDDENLAVGFLFGEGVVRGIDDVAAIDPCAANVVRVDLASGVDVPWERLARHVYATSSCGTCGKTSIEALRPKRRADAIPDADLRVGAAVIASLPAKLRAQQRAFAVTGGVHAAALFEAASGRLLDAREDVGRHNAVDKVVGAALRGGRAPLTRDLLFVSGRAGFELVQKASMAGIAVMAAVGAPSSLAVELARDTGITLCGFVRDERFVVYAGKERIVP